MNPRKISHSHAGRLVLIVAFARRAWQLLNIRQPRIALTWRRCLFPFSPFFFRFCSFPLFPLNITTTTTTTTSQQPQQTSDNKSITMSLPQRAEMVKAVMLLAAVNFIFQFGLILDEVPMPTIIKNALCDAGYGKGTSQKHPHLCMHSWLQVEGECILPLPIWPARTVICRRFVACKHTC